MGRPSKLSDAQKDDIRKRLLSGEKAIDLAKEYKIDRAAITRMFSQQIATIKDVANQIVSVDVALSKMPVAQQIATIQEADHKRAMNEHLMQGGVKAASLFHRFSNLAAMHSDKLDETDLDSDESNTIRKTIAQCLSIANNAALIPMDIARLDKAKDKDDGKKVIEHIDRPIAACPK